MPQVAWSFSALKTFQSCPKKYYHLKVVKDVKDSPSEIMLYGIDAHKAAEMYIAEGTELPGKYEFMRKQLDTLKNLDGDKYCEYKFGLTRDMKPCDFFAKDVWLRGAIDLLVVNEEKGTARMIDYKFGKSKNADMSQLQLMSLAVFKIFPSVKTVKAGLLFCPEDKMIPTQYSVDDAPNMWMQWLPEVARLEAAYEHDVWNASPSGLCKAWCPVLSCPHNGRTS
jgi:hypothetical protein